MQPGWIFSFEDAEMPVTVARAGKDFIKKACLDNVQVEIFCSDSVLEYSYIHCDEEDMGDVEINKKQHDHPEEEKSGTDEKIESEPGGAAVQRYVPDRILLGSFTVGEKEVYWEFGHPTCPIIYSGLRRFSGEDVYDSVFALGTWQSRTKQPHSRLHQRVYYQAVRIRYC